MGQNDDQVSLTLSVGHLPTTRGILRQTEIINICLHIGNQSHWRKNIHVCHIQAHRTNTPPYHEFAFITYAYAFWFLYANACRSNTDALVHSLNSISHTPIHPYVHPRLNTVSETFANMCVESCDISFHSTTLVWANMQCMYDRQYENMSPVQCSTVWPHDERAPNSVELAAAGSAPPCCHCGTKLNVVTGLDTCSNMYRSQSH